MRDILTAPLATALREATRATHHRLDHHPLLAPLVRPELTLDHYRRVLRAMVRIHLPLQDALAQALRSLGLSFELADRVGWLAEDLQRLDGRPPQAPPVTWPVPEPASPAALVGMLYVIEGAGLGGQVIARQLAGSLGLDAASGARFFHGVGEHTGERWAAFWRFAETTCPPGQTAEAAQAAVALFDQFWQVCDAALAQEEA